MSAQQQRHKIILVACGCFSPITNLHLRLFELAKDFLNRTGRYEVLEGVISPTHDSYGKKGLVPAIHRVEMCRLATESSDWINVSDWEVRQDGWTPTSNVLTQYNREAISRGASVRFLCGADLLESFSVPGLWSDEDIENIVRNIGMVVVNRIGYNPQRFIYKVPTLWKYQSNIEIVTEVISNTVSSTKIRQCLARGQSVKYLIPDPVVNYLHQHPQLYLKDVLDQFQLSSEDVENITGNMFTDIVEGLSRHNHFSPLRVHTAPLAITNLSAIKNRTMLVINWSSDSLTACLVTISDGRFTDRPVENLNITPGSFETIEDICGTLKQHVSPLLAESAVAACLVHGFSVSDQSLTLAAVNSTGVWKIVGDSSTDIVRLLESTLDKKGLKVVSNVTAALTYGIHEDENCHIALFLDDNVTNSCYRQKASSIPRLEMHRDDPVIVVTNWGSFGQQNKCLDEYRTEFDLVVDAESENRGEKILDKMVAVKNLSDITWRVCIDLIAKEELFGGRLPAALSKEAFLQLIDCIAHNQFRTDCSEVESLLETFSITCEANDLALLRRVTSQVYQRAISLMASAIAALCKQLDSATHCTVLVSGRGWEYCSLECINKELESLVSGKAVKLRRMEDGIVYGAALLASISQH